MCEVLKIGWEGRKGGGGALRHPEIRNCICRLESAGDVVKCIWDIAVFQTDLLIILHTSVEERKLYIPSKKIPDYFSKETDFSSMTIFETMTGVVNHSLVASGSSVGSCCSSNLMYSSS